MAQAELEEIVGWIIISILCNGAMLAPVYLAVFYLAFRKGGDA